MRSRPVEQRRAANMIYFLAAIVPLSGACKGSAGAQAGTNTISSGGSEIRRAPLGKRSGADWPWAGPGSTMPGHSLPSKGGDKALWMPGAQVGSREGGSGPQSRVLSLTEASSGPGCVSPGGGTLPCAAPRGIGSPGMALPHQRAAGGSSGPAWLRRDDILDPAGKGRGQSGPGECHESCPLPTGFCSASPAGRAWVTVPQTQCPGSPRASAASR